jgi:transcriptional regulator with XRE-family HTH domain
MPSSSHTAGYKLFRRRLVAARTERGLSQRDVAHLLRWPQSQISRMETGERRVDVIELAALAAIYKKPLTFFLD